MRQDSKLSDVRRRHLREMADGRPFWRPSGSAEFRSAHALQRKGYLRFVPGGRLSILELTDAGREAVEEGR